MGSMPCIMHMFICFKDFQDIAPQCWLARSCLPWMWWHCALMCLKPCMMSDMTCMNGITLLALQLGFHLSSLLVVMWGRQAVARLKDIIHPGCSGYGMKNSREDMAGRCVIRNLCYIIPNSWFNVTGKWVIVHIFLETLVIRFVFVLIIKEILLRQSLKTSIHGQSDK